MKCAKAYRISKGRLCERCYAKGLIVPGEEVHHKIRLTPENINDPAIALNWDNLELLCKNCHMEEHRAKRWRADELGHVDL
jgi:5-methylcytosine-specific restriction endonuclease McrA